MMMLISQLVLDLGYLTSLGKLVTFNGSMMSKMNDAHIDTGDQSYKHGVETCDNSSDTFAANLPLSGDGRSAISVEPEAWLVLQTDMILAWMLQAQIWRRNVHWRCLTR